MYIERTLGDRCSLPPRTHRNSLSPWSINICDASEFASFFGIPSTKLNKLLVVKRCDRRGGILALKTIGSILQCETPSKPRLFCLGGKADVWNTTCVFFRREHGHRTEAGLFSTPFTRIRSAEEHALDMAKFDTITCETICVKWVPNETDTLCSTGQSASITMGKLVVQIPVITFNDMTIARKVNECISNQSDDMESDSSSTSY